jgi:hypothetical protein
MRRLAGRALVVFAAISLTACGPESVPLRTGLYSFKAIFGTGAPASIITAASTLELDVATREVKLTVGSATRNFRMATTSTSTSGCPTNTASSTLETRSLDAPNIQVGDALVDEPLLRSECPASSNSVVLQTGPVTGAGAARDCSDGVVCLVYARK